MRQSETADWVAKQLDIYCETREPGYAVLIDAPWGSGKTYAIKTWAERRKDTVYLSLYGVSSYEQYEDRLLEAILYKDKTLRPPKLAKAVESIASRVSGSPLGITNIYRWVALRAVPRVVIVDDLERVDLKANEVFGLVNSLLEHHGRNLILIAHQEELISKWSNNGESYLRIKEKVIGRILPFYPDIETVLSSFIEQFKSTSFLTKATNFFVQSRSDKYASKLSSEVDFLVSIFERTESKNLRVFRQSLRDFEPIFSLLSELVHADKEKIRLVLGSYLALSMLYHGGNVLDESALRQEVSWSRFASRANGEQEQEPNKEPIENAREMFLGINEVVLDGSIISGDLAVRLIAKGEFTDSFVRDELLKSPHLIPSKANAWRTLWQWAHEAPSTVTDSLRSVCNSLNAKEFRDPVIIVHVFCILRSMEESGVKLPLKDSVERYFKIYIADLVHMGEQALLRPTSAYSNSISNSNNTGLGFVKEGGDFFKMVISHLQEVMDKAFWDNLRGDPGMILREMREDPREFLRSIDNRGRSEGNPNYAHLPVIAFLKPTAALDELLKTGPSHVGTFISIMARRVQRLEQIEKENRTFDWPEERDWMKEFCRELKGRAELTVDSIASAQLSELSRHCISALENLPKQRK
jgi:hypothetical protein